MSFPILIDIAVRDLPGAVAIAAAARSSGAAGVRVHDTAGDGPALDPSVVASYLAGTIGDIGYLVDVPTTGNAPYNAARRILSFDRATAGRAGVVLRPGADDEVSRATTPDPAASDPARRWAEYAIVLTRLWESFPRAALIADQERALVVDRALISAIDHEGSYYRVAGPLDGPSSVQGRPVLAAAEPHELGWDVVAHIADVVVVDRDRAAGANAALTAALAGTGRQRSEIVLLGRARVAAPADPRAVADELAAWVAADGLDGLSLAPVGDTIEIVAAIEALTPLLATPVTGPTLREALGLRTPAGALR
ncbi:LLM class flavin-dependent oxidoreductase [Nocardia sp. NPDC057668]|uniref:LLM class flavin-dependent oxidoreductase n=1 Tax=Nocardia sp. NPDC057668 TaxID=3346202 RepID=UPI00366F76A0